MGDLQRHRDEFLNSAGLTLVERLSPETEAWSEEMERIFMRGRDEAVAENERLGLKQEDFLPDEGFATPRVAEED